MNATANLFTDIDLETGFFSDLADGGFGGTFTRLDFPADEGPRRFSVVAPSYQDTGEAGDDGRDNRTRFRHG
jgi:hypothetical protein